LTNTAIRSFSWDDVTVTVKDRESKQPKDILSGVNGMVKAGTYSQLPTTSVVIIMQYILLIWYSEAGEMLALMGPRSVSQPCSTRVGDTISLSLSAYTKLTQHQWLWQNNTPQRPRSSRRRNERRYSQTIALPKRREAISRRLPEAQLLRRARRRTRRLANCSRDYVFRS
jgi:hypothetical protein